MKGFKKKTLTLHKMCVTVTETVGFSHTNPYIWNVTQRCQCSPMLIFRAWATCAMSLLLNIWNTIVTIHFDSQWRWLPHRLSKRQSLSTGLRSPGLPYSSYLLMTWLLGLNHFFVSVVTIADLITNCSAAWYKEEPRWGLKQCIVIKGPC